MKKLIVSGFVATLLFSCGPKMNDLASNTPIITTVDLINIQNDKAMSTVDPGRFTEDEVTFFIPKTVPGTYSDDNYGKFIEDFKAYDYDGNELAFSHPDENTWVINNATQLDKVTYWVNDSFDSEQGGGFGNTEDVFSPAGSNIKENENFFLNLHMFVGYFKGFSERPYEVTFKHPAEFKASTSLQGESIKDETTDTFYANRYFEITDNPIMYSKLDQEKFKVNDIEITLSVYSPTGAVKAAELKGGMEKMMKAQKTFLGDINGTKHYDILLYLSTMGKEDAKGFGALEHHTSTTVVLPESMGIDALTSTMTDVVSHEFFHIVAPLTIHSDEIQYFDYNAPKMSEHLWMYEGVTEYFANLFQINQGLIDENEFYTRMQGKIENSKAYDDNMSFTVMSKNVLVDPYKPNYANVYEKGALIGMCIDIIIREQSNGEKGILWLMKQLSERYGTEKSFQDSEIIAEITKLTYPEVGEFLNTYVIQANNPIPYGEFLNKVGLEFGEREIQAFNYFLEDQQNPYIDVKEADETVYFRNRIALNSFLTDLGVQGGDVIKSINGTEYNMQNVRNMIMASFGWKEGDDIAMVVVRDGKEVALSGKVTKPMAIKKSIATNPNATPAQIKLREAWLKG